ncbi:hypothetical protein MTYM_01785 [Methylococcales bacterium]|nr:hypothetical protein MTYM_01785 [Methylococcales bacterium]
MRNATKSPQDARNDRNPSTAYRVPAGSPTTHLKNERQGLWAGVSTQPATLLAAFLKTGILATL